MKVIAFDVFGTVVDFSGVERDDVRNYIAQIQRPEWAPLELPKSWESLPAFPDSAEGINRLREKYIVVTCSNGPLGLLTRLSKNAGIQWDAIIPLEMFKVYKPNPEAYLALCEVLAVNPKDVAMVTANPLFGDIEWAGSLGMTPILIRGESEIQTITQLADSLGVTQ